MRENILIVAEHRKGHGTGHLRRCAQLVTPLVRIRNSRIDWLLPRVTDNRSYSRDEVFSLAGAVSDLPVRWVDTPEGPYDLVLVDCRSFSHRTITTLPVRGIVLGLDAGGELRSFASYLIDTLPVLPGTSSANLTDPGFLFLPEKIRSEWPITCQRALVAFGGEEQDRHTLEVADTLADREIQVEALVHHSANTGYAIRTIDPADNLAETLHTFDLVVTHFGMLAYEALWARVPVLLINPTRYHARLAGVAGLPCANRPADLSGALDDFTGIAARSRSARPSKRRNLAERIGALQIPGRAPGIAIERFPDRTYFRDQSDGLVYMQRFAGASVDYGHDYFFSEYRKQYGRTYLEDFDAIVSAGRRRVRVILSLLADRSTPQLLDIGSAFGPFLVAAAEKGVRVKGLEINAEAVKYINNTLGLEAIEGDLATLEPEAFQELFDIVTMWYVIEHVRDLDNLMRRVAALLRSGGVFAFSTPHGKGISARRSPRAFYRASPADHFTIWDIPAAERVLSRYGFRVRAVRVTGHHPERFSPRWPRALYPLLRTWSRVFRLGDTFEVYAERL